MKFESEKGPTEIIDYTIDYSIIFAKSTPADQIATSIWSVVGAGLIVGVDSIVDNNKAVVRVSAGGVLGFFHRLVNHITCISGREHERTIHVEIRDQDQ